MPVPNALELTQLLQKWHGGQDDAFDELAPLVYGELHRLARCYMKGERRDHTLQATALVHEAYVKLKGSQRIRWKSRDHFYAVAARFMRRVLVDFARKRNADKRGGGEPLVRPENEDALPGAPDLTRIDDALNALASERPRVAHVVELRFFGGFSVEDTAFALDVSPDTVMRDWKFAKAWLSRALSV